MREVMQPVLAPIDDALSTGRRHHQHCLDTIDNARTNTVSVDQLPNLEPMVFDRTSRTTRPLLVATLRLTKFASAAKQLYHVVDWAQPAPVTIGVAFDKPHSTLIPLTGVTPAGWQVDYPPFHYSASGRHEVCMGYTFKIGDCTDLAVILPQLIDVLSWVNLSTDEGGAYMPLLSASERYPTGVWPWWAAAASRLEMGEEQPIFLKIPMLTV